MDLSSVEHPGYDRLAPSTVRDLTSPFQIPEPEDVACPGCGNRYQSVGLGHHWVQSSECHHPPLTDHQRDLVTGLLMGDGSLNRSSKNPRLKVGMVTARYLQYLDTEFGVLSTGVRLARTATEKARENRGTDFSPNAAAENYQDVYRWKTRCLPELADFSSWYDSGKKVWPSDIQLTPTVLRTLYVGDGCWHTSGRNDCITIGMSNEVEHTDKVDSYFERADLPTPSNYNTWGRDGSRNCNAVFTQEDSRELFRYMAPAPPGFTRKFPERYHGTNPLKRRLRGRDYRGPFAAVTLTDEELRKVPLEPRVNVDGTDKVTFRREDLEGWLA